MNFESKFGQLVAKIKQIGITKNNFQDALDWGELYGRLLYTNYPDKYRDDDFEKKLISRYISEFPPVEIKVQSNNELHIISEPYSTGGHTRLLEKILKIRGQGDVLVTRPLPLSQNIQDVLNVRDSSNIYFSNEQYTIENIIEIAGRYKKIFLHIHPDDLTCAVAMGVIKQKYDIRIMLINHADHIFSYGYYASTVVVEMGPFGEKLRQVKSRGQATYLGLPFDIDEFKKVELKRLKQGISIMSGATSFKYDPIAGLSFSQLAREVLTEIPNSKFTIIGPSLNYEWRRLMFKFKGRLKVVPKLPFEEYKKLMEGVDVYIDSFPLSGGTTVPEVRSKQIPVTGVLCGSYGYTPWDKTKYTSNADLILALKELGESSSSDIINRNNDEALIAECNQVHGFSHFKKRLDNLLLTGVAGEAQFNHDVNYSYFNDYWKQQKKLLLGKSSYLFLLKNWKGGGRDVMFLAMAINPLKYSMKLIAGYIKLLIK